MGTITHSAVSDRWDTPLERRLYPVSAAAVSQATFHLLQRFCPSCLDTAGAPEIPNETKTYFLLFVYPILVELSHFAEQF